MAATIETGATRIACDDLTSTYLRADMEETPEGERDFVCYRWSREDFGESGEAVYSPYSRRIGVNLNGQPEWADVPADAGDDPDAIAAYMVDLSCNDAETFLELN